MNLHERINSGEFENKVSFSKETRAEFRSERDRLHNLFRAALREEYGYELSSKTLDRIESKSYDDASGESLHGWAHHYEELADFARMVLAESKNASAMEYQSRNQR